MQEQLAEQLRRAEELELTFKPKTLAYPGITSRLAELQGTTLRDLHNQREQQRLANLRAQEVGHASSMLKSEQMKCALYLQVTRSPWGVATGDSCAFAFPCLLHAR